MVFQVFRLTTLGAEKASGLLHALDFKQGSEIQDWDGNCLVPFQVQLKIKTCCNIWTVDTMPNGMPLSLGTSLL